MRQQPRPSCHQKGHSVLGWLLIPQETRAQHIVHPWDPRMVFGVWFLVPLACREGSGTAAREAGGSPYPPSAHHISMESPNFSPSPKLGIFPWRGDAEGRLGAARGLWEPPRAAAPQGSPPPWSLLGAVCFCCFLNSSKTAGNGTPERQVWGLFCFVFFPGGILRQGKKALERQGECHGAPPQWILMGFPTFERDRNTV